MVLQRLLEFTRPHISGMHLNGSQSSKPANSNGGGGGSLSSPDLITSGGSSTRRAAWSLLLDNLVDFPTAAIDLPPPSAPPLHGPLRSELHLRRKTAAVSALSELQLPLADVGVIFAEAETDDPQRQPPALSNVGYPITHLAAVFPAGVIVPHAGDGEGDGSDDVDGGHKEGIWPRQKGLDDASHEDIMLMGGPLGPIREELGGDSPKPHGNEDLKGRHRRLVAIARRTSDVVNEATAFAPGNGFCLSWPPAAR